jgi:hypothetical protein
MRFILQDNLYAVRRSFIRQELKNFSLELYGDLWIKARFKRMKYLLRISLYLFKTRTPINPFRKLSWVFEEYAGAKGVVKDKLHLLKQSKFNLIIENSSDFVTEKLFDAILCGTIPIYLGPVFHKDPLLEKALIRVTEAELLGSNLELIIQRSGYSVESILESMTQLMSSGQFVERWTAKGVFHSLLNDLVQYLKSVPIRVI